MASEYVGVYLADSAISLLCHGATVEVLLHSIYVFLPDLVKLGLLLLPVEHLLLTQACISQVASSFDYLVDSTTF